MPLYTSVRAWATTSFLTTVACLGMRSAYAYEPGYQVTVGVQESDNVQLLPSGGSSATMPFEELDFTWHDKRPFFTADIDADLEHINYIPHLYDEQFVGNFIGSGRINLVQQLLTWNTSENFGQTRLTPLAPITPANREYINYLDTGPTLALPLLGRELQLDVTATYGRVDYQDSPFDSNRVTGGIALVHELSRLSSVSLNVTDERVYYVQDQLNPDYSSQEVFAQYTANGSRTKLGVDLGYSRTQQTGFSQGSYLARISLSRNVSAASIIGLSAGHDYSDGAGSFLEAQTVGGANLNTQSTVQTSAPFSSNYATLEWNFQYARTSWGINASYFQDRYTTEAAFNNDLEMLNGRFARQISPEIELALTEQVVRQVYDGEDGNATETNTGLQLTWHAGRHLSVMFAYYYEKSSSDIPADAYTENSLWLSVGYGRPAELPPGPPPLRLPGGFNF
jgi:hypothetical protein